MLDDFFSSNVANQITCWLTGFGKTLLQKFFIPYFLDYRPSSAIHLLQSSFIITEERLSASLKATL